MKKVIIIQARTGSSRFPKKILKLIKGKTVLEHVINRLKKCKLIDDIIIATTVNIEDNSIIDICEKLNIKYFRGSENNVLSRYYNTANLVSASVILRITSDCPLIDYKIIDDMLLEYLKNENEIDDLRMKFSNGDHTFPDGFNCEIFSFNALKKAYEKSNDKYEIEHVTPYIFKNFKSKEYKIKLLSDYNNINFNKLHLSLDTFEDFELINNIFNNLYDKNNFFSIDDVLEYLNNNNKILEKNQNKIIIEKKDIIKKECLDVQKCNDIDFVTKYGIKIKDFSYSNNIFGYKNEEINNNLIVTINKGTFDLPINDTFIKLKNYILYLEKNNFLNLYLFDSLISYILFISEKHNILIPKNYEKYYSSKFIYKNNKDILNLIKENNIDYIILTIPKIKNKIKDFIYLFNLVKQKNIKVILDERETSFKISNGGYYKKLNLIPDIIIFGNHIINNFKNIIVLSNINFDYNNVFNDFLLNLIYHNLKYFNDFNIYKHNFNLINYFQKKIIFLKKFNIKINENLFNISINFKDIYNLEKYLFEKNIYFNGIFKPNYKINESDIDFLFFNLLNYLKKNQNNKKIS